MFIIERRTAGVLAALAITGALVILGNIWDRMAAASTPSGTVSPAVLATSAVPGSERYSVN